MTRGIELFAAYDQLRLETYQRREQRDNRIQVVRLATATALRFDETGYFNRVYSPDGSIFGHLDAVEEFYFGNPHGCELICPPQTGKATGRACWTKGKRYAWLYAKPLPAPAPLPDSAFTIHEPEAHQQTEFLETYLQAFGAAPDRFPAAIRNMRHLFSLPEISFLWAKAGVRPAAVAMLYQSERSAVLCAGAALPQWRERGCHAALLAARIRLAAASGCDEITSWAEAGGQSQANMERAGLKVAGITEAWKLAPSAA